MLPGRGVSRLEEETIDRARCVHVPVLLGASGVGYPEAADAAPVWHLFEVHPLRWRAIAGDRCPTDLPPTRLGHRLTCIGSV